MLCVFFSNRRKVEIKIKTVCVSKILYNPKKEKKNPQMWDKYSDKCKVTETAVPNTLLVSFSQQVPVYLSTLSVRD